MRSYLTIKETHIIFVDEKTNNKSHLVCFSQGHIPSKWEKFTKQVFWLQICSLSLNHAKWNNNPFTHNNRYFSKKKKKRQGISDIWLKFFNYSLYEKLGRNHFHEWKILPNKRLSWISGRNPWKSGQAALA